MTVWARKEMKLHAEVRSPTFLGRAIADALRVNWELLGQVAEAAKGPAREALKDALEEVEEQEDEHLYHTTGWTRELWIASLGMPVVLPPPEEEKEVKTAISAARAKMARKEML